MRDRSRPPPPVLNVAAQVPLPPSPKPFARFFTSNNCSRTPQEIPLPPSPSPALLAFPSSNSSSSASSSPYSEERNYPPSHFSPPNSPEPKLPSLTALRRRLTSLSFNYNSNSNASASSSNLARASTIGIDLGAPPTAGSNAEQYRISQPHPRQQRPPLSPSAFNFNNPRPRPPLPPSPLITSYAPSPQRDQLKGIPRERKRFWNGRVGAGEEQRRAPKKLGEALGGLVKRARSKMGKGSKVSISMSMSADLDTDSVRWTREVDVEQESQLKQAVKGLFDAEPRRVSARSDGWYRRESSVYVQGDAVVAPPTSPKIHHHSSPFLSHRTNTPPAPCSPTRRSPVPFLPQPSLGTSFEMDRLGFLFDDKVDDHDHSAQARKSIRQVSSTTVLSLRKEEGGRTSRRSISSPSLRLAPTSTTSSTSTLDAPSLPPVPNSPRPRRLLDTLASHSCIEYSTNAYVDGGWDTGTPMRKRRAGEGETIRIRNIEPTPPWLRSFEEQARAQEREQQESRAQELAREGRAGGDDRETSFELHRQAGEQWLAQQEQSDDGSAFSSRGAEEEEEPQVADSPLQHRTRPSASFSDLSNLANTRQRRPLPLPPFSPPPCPPQPCRFSPIEVADDQNAPLPPRLNRRVRLDASPSHGKDVVINDDKLSWYTESEGSVDHEVAQREIIDEMDRLLDEMGGVSDDEDEGEVVWEGSRFEDTEGGGVERDGREGFGLEDRSLVQSPTFGRGFSAFLLASRRTSSTSNPFDDSSPFDDPAPSPTLPANQQQSQLASRRGRSPLPPLDLPRRNPADVEVAPSGYHSEASEEQEQVGNWAFEEQEQQQEESQVWTPTPESEEKTPRLPFPTAPSHSTKASSTDPSFPSSSTPPRLPALSFLSPSVSFPFSSPSYASNYSSSPSLPPAPPRRRTRTLSTPSLLLGPFSPPIRQPDSPTHYFTPSKASPSLAQSPGSVLVSSGGPRSQDWRLSPVLVGGRETLRRWGSERG
ncbi:hypothetical protein BCR35DRAFT_51203 [Leucosporidium creatinivorum]|uniref:Uncharacterized protein n=1 Tax=Leucosporidium creatinivorum TaxID=106004 RepID=A0A1Y2FPZ8_9BASI|nr:hypothetical protein BCR35DRAFT_51203 [Leucosporidium creatinivorum]